MPTRPGAAPTNPKRPCCMVSELLEEAGITRQKARALKRQVLEGLILHCRWQLERMEEPAPSASRRRARQVTVE